MSLLLDSFWRAVAYCLRPRVMLLSLAPLLLMLVLGLGLGHLYWAPAVAWMRSALDAWPLLASLWGWMQGLLSTDVRDLLAPLLLVLAVTPIIVLLALVIVASLMAPSLTRLVAERRFAALQKKQGASMLGSVLRSLGLTALAVVAMVVSMPLWLVPPLVLVLPPLIWGWLTAQVMAYDALAEHASAAERQLLLQRHRWPLLGIGVLCGYLGAAPSVVWASGVIFAAAFFVLVPLAIWIYTLVFAFSALWFAHYVLAALQQHRAAVEAEPPAPALEAGAPAAGPDAPRVSAPAAASPDAPPSAP